MSVYKRIDSILEERKISRRQLAIEAGIPPSTFQSALSREKNITMDMLQKIAIALEVTVAFLIGYEAEDTTNPLWNQDLETKLKQVGFSTVWKEDQMRGECYLWINYPDGTLEVSENDLKELNNSTNDFMRFKLEELRKKHLQDFRPRGR